MWHPARPRPTGFDGFETVRVTIRVGESVCVVECRMQTVFMAVRRLPDLTPQQVVRLQDALLANADTLLSSAVALLEIGHVALARSLAILGLEESGKAIAVHERRVAMGYAADGETFRCEELDHLWGSHEE